MADVEKMITLMGEFWETQEGEVSKYDGQTYLPTDDLEEKFDEMIDLIWKNLFFDGTWNYEVVDAVINAGFDCYAGDQDSFGILVACIEKDGKILAIG